LIIPIKRPADAAEITVFITTTFDSLSLFEIYIDAPAFINNDVIKIIRVPAIRKLILEAKNVLEQFYLYILKISIICLLFRSLVRFGKSNLNLIMFCALIFIILFL
jgi:hypothetical protein